MGNATFRDILEEGSVGREFYDKLPFEEKVKIVDEISKTDPAFLSLNETNQAKFKKLAVGENPDPRAEVFDLGEAVVSAGAETIGSGVAVAKFGAKRATAVPAAIGSALGSLAVQGTELVGKKAGIDIPFIDEENAPKSFKESAIRTTTAAATGMFGQKVGEQVIKGGQAIIKGGEKLLSKIPLEVEAGAKEAQELLQPHGGTLTAGEALKTNAFNKAESIVEQAFFAGKLKETKQINKQIITDLTEKYVASLKSEGIEASAEALKQSVIKESEIFKKAGTALYKQVDELTPPTFSTVPKKGSGGLLFEKRITKGGVDLSNLKAQAASLKKVNNKSLTPSSKLNSVLDKILKKDDVVSFKDAHGLRSDMLSITRSLDDPAPNRTAGSLRSLAKKIDKSMENTAKRFGGDVLKRWRVANKFWQEGKVTFNSSLVKKLVNSLEPDKVAGTLIQANSPLRIKLIKKAAGQKKWNLIKDEFIKKVFSNPANQTKEGLINFTNVDKQLRRLGAATLDEAGVTPAALKKLIRVGKLTEKQGVQAAGKFALTIGQVTSLGRVAFLGFSPFDLVVIFGPQQIAKIVTNPRIVNALIKGQKISPKLSISKRNEMMTTAIARMSALLTKEGIEHDIKTKQQAADEEELQ